MTEREGRRKEEWVGVCVTSSLYSCVVAILDYLGHWEILKGWGSYIFNPFCAISVRFIGWLDLSA